MLKFLLAIDGSAPSLRAIETVARLARGEMPLEVTLLNVRDTSALPQDLADAELATLHAAQQHDQDHVLNEAQSRALGCGLHVTGCVAGVGAPASEIVRTASARKADQIVLGAHGKHALAGGSLLPGSVAQHVLCLATQPVLLVP